MDACNNTEPLKLWCVDARNGHAALTSLPAPVVRRAVGDGAGDFIRGQGGDKHTLLLGRYTVRSDWDDGCAAAFVIQRLSDAGAPLDIIRFTVCRDTGSAHKALSFLGTSGFDDGQLPFMCWRPVENNIHEEDDRMMTALLMEQKILAYAWLDGAFGHT